MAYENMTVIDVRKRNSDGTYGTAFSISEGIVGDSMRLSQILFNSNYINLGEINSDMFEVELDISFLPEAYQNLKGYFIDVKRYNSDGASTYGHIFRGYIKDFKLDKTGQFATITAFDMYWYKKNIETSLASWWGDFWRSKVLESVQLPISLGINPSWTASQVNDYVKQYVYNLIPNDCYATIGELFDSFLDYTNTDYSMKGDTKDEIEDCTNYNARVYLKHCSLGSASGFIGSGVWNYADTYNISIRDIHYDWLQSQDSTLSYEYLLSQFCQALGLVPHFANREQQIWDGDSIKLNLFTFSTELTSKLLDDTNIDYSASSFESVYMPSFDKLIVTSSTTSGENQSELQPYEYGTGSMSYTIVDNPFLCAVSGTYNEQAIANLYDIISGFPVYLPSDITLVDSNWYDGPTGSNLNYIYDLGDKVETSRGTIVVMQTEFSGTGFINQSIRCLGDTDEITQFTSQVTPQASSSISTIGTIVNLFQYNAMKDNLISGATLKDATITGGKIANSTITSTQIADSTITNAKIANSTITGSKIVDGTLDGSTKIANATISFAKMDNSFVGSLVADSAFVTELQAEIASFGYITAQQADLDYAQIDFANVANGTINTALIHDGAITDAKIANATISFAKIDSSFIGSLVADSAFIQDLQAEIATFGYITAQQADLAYMKTTFANMDTANINKANIGTLFNEVGLITSATIQDGHITGYLDAVEVNANKITAGTLIADRLILTYTQGGVTHYRLLDHFDAQDNPVYTTLNGDTITERTIRANHIVADSITANEIATGTITADEIAAHTITADEMSITDLSTISANMGTITAGTLQSDNYVADTSGMRLTLSNGVWDSKYFKLDATGAITSTAGTIGGWTISSNSIYAGSQSGGITQTVSINSSIPSINLVHLETGKNLNTILGPDSIYIEGRLSNYTADVALTYDNLVFTQTGGGTVYNSAFTPQIFGMSSKKTGQDVALNMTSKGIRITDNLNGNEFSFDYASGIDFTDGTNAVFGVDTAGNLDCQDLTAYGDISTNGSLEVSTDATIYGPITTTGNGTIGGTLSVSGNTTLTENLSVSGTTTLTGLVSAIGGIDVRGEVEGVTLKINDTTNSSFSIAGGGSIGGTLSTSTITSTGAISTTSTISATGDITTSGNVSSATVTTSSTITSTGLITAKNGVDSWGKLEGNTLKINNTGASSFTIAGGGSIAGTLTVPTVSLTNGGSITSSQGVVSISASVLITSASYMTISNKKVVVDDYSSNFMGFTTATVTKTVDSGTSTLTNLTYVDLTPGVYAVECTAEWDSNSTTGYRHLVLSTSSTGGPVDRFAAVTGPAGPSYDRQSFVRLFHLTSNTRFYLNAQQNSGSRMSVLGGIQALRLGNN